MQEVLSCRQIQPFSTSRKGSIGFCRVPQVCPPTHSRRHRTHRTRTAMDNLTDATMLVAELTSKLAELDRKVSVYRLGMAAEFTKHSEELLKNVPEDVAYHVSRAIEESLPNFPSLYPPGSLQSSRSPTPTLPEEIAWHGNKSPPPILPHTSGHPKHPQNHDLSRPSQNIQRERDQEFSGLFVPSYLPLLESTDRPLHLPTASLDAPSSAEFKKPATAELTQASDGRCERRRPSPLRRTTDTSVDSAASDSSSAKTRKSALRRSSSSSKADSPRDPRRVRFDFEGKEVLPSSSPKTSSDTLTGADTTRTREKSALAHDSYTTTTSVGDIEGEQDELIEKPKKVSSTQALRALSKTPLDEGTVWTVVNPGTGSEESSDADKSRYTPESNSPRASSLVNSPTGKMAPKNTLADNTRQTMAGSKEADAEKPATTMEESEEEQSESDDEPALFMASKKGSKKKSKDTALLRDDKGSEPHATKPTLSPILATQSTKSTSSPTPAMSYVPTDAKTAPLSVGKATSVVEAGATTKAGTSHKDVHRATTSTEDDADELFAFDGEEKSGNKTEKYLPESRDEDAEPDDEVVSHPAEDHRAHSGLPSSPPINVPARARASPEHRIPKKVPPQPESTRQPSMSIGSLGNRPLTAGPVKDQQLLEKVSKLDVEVPFFVGSVNGRSGPDASNVKSYQASLMSPNQASGSFAERFMWEKSQGILYDSDAEDSKKNDKNGKQNRR